MKRLALIAIFLAPYWHQAIAQEDTSLVERGERLGEIVVTGTRNETDIRHLPMTVSIVDRNLIEQNNVPSLMPVLSRQIPGFFVTSRGVMGYGVSGGAAGGMSLRGISGGSGRLMVLIDGHPQYMGIMGHPIADAYQSLLAERVEVLRGPASVLYGSNAMGGVINIVTRKMKEDGVSTSFNVGYGSHNTLQTEFSNRLHKGRFTSVVGASYNRTDGHRKNMEFEQYGGYVKLGYELGENWNMWADVNVTHFNASQPGSLDAPLEDADQRITRGMASFALENRYENTSGTLSLFYNWGRHRINDGYNASAVEEPLLYRFNSRDRMMGISWYQSAQLFKGNRITVGADWFGFGGEAWNRFVAGEKEGAEVSIVDKDENEVAGYVDVRQGFSRWLTVNAGLRVDNHSQAGCEVIPQFGAAIHLPGGIELKLSANKGFRYPLIREMFMWGAANPLLEAERMWNYEAAFSQKVLHGRLSYGLNIFHLKGDNMIVTTSVDGKMQNLNTGEIENTGIEVEFAYSFASPFRIDANYSWLDMKNPVAGAPEHKLYLGGTYWSRKWNVSSGVQYVADLYKSSSAGDTENFLLWDAKVSYNVLEKFSVWARCENILGQEYEIMAGYPMPGTTVMFGVNVAL
ncbi:MAG: TonB-dependent receptor [Bacteroidales bacterium]|nr:TonB-dependent receptor [Bacteroidales bacterium]